jgi:RecB family exonuclease
MLAGLYGDRAQFERVFPAAITEAMNIHGVPKRNRIERIAGARVALLNELDPDLRTTEGRRRSSTVGPYFGFVGTIQEAADPRRGRLYITTMEAMAACPWRTFIRRLLRIEPTPDPMQALPTLTPLMRGATVHAVLERIVRDAGGRNACRLKDTYKSDPVAVRWPESSDLQGLAREEAERVLREAGMGLHGLTRALEAQASPYVATAEQIDWHDDGTAIYALGAELEGDLAIEDDAGVQRSIFFKADRADRHKDLLVLTDYKTGHPVSSAVTEKSRKDHLLREIRKGESLQAVAYVLGAGEEATQGRYLFLKPDTPDHARVFAVNPGEQQYLEAFMEAVRALLSAWDNGVFFPRLLEPDGKREPRRCRYCEVMEACLRWDSGARARMAAWVDGLEKRNGKRACHEGAFIRCWRLGISNAAENGK